LARVLSGSRMEPTVPKYMREGETCRGKDKFNPPSQIKKAKRYLTYGTALYSL